MEVWESVLKGKQHDKNRRMRVARKRRRDREAWQQGNMHIKIDAAPAQFRMLRTTPRKALKKEADGKHIVPWIRNNPNFRFQEHVYASASLQGLPTEIRHRILGLSLRDKNPFLDPSSETMQMEALRKRIAELCCVSPLIRRDMVYVGKRQKEELLAELQEKAEAERNGFIAVGTADGVTRWDQTLPLNRNRKGKVVIAKPLPRKNRPQKCWKCDERHPIGGECRKSSRPFLRCLRSTSR